MDFASIAPCLALVLPFAVQEPSALVTRAAAPAVEAAPAEEQVHDLAGLMPENTLLFVEGPGLSRFVRQGLGQPLMRRILASPLGDALTAELEASPADLVAFVEDLYGLSLFETAGSLLEGGVAFGLHPRERGEPGATFAARSNDDLAWSENLARLLELASTAGDLPPAWIDPMEGPGGSETWSFGPDLAMAQQGGTVVVSNDRRRYQEILTRLTGRERDAFPAAKYFNEARVARDESALLWGWLDLARAVELSQGGGGFGDFRRMPEQPAVQMLLGSGFAALGRAAELTSELDLDTDSLRWRLTGHGVELGAMQRLLPGDDPSALVMPRRSEREVGRLVAYRDFGAVFEQRAELFPAELLPEFSRVSSELAPLLGGLDLGEELLPELSPWIRIVAREVDFDATAEPEMPLPAVVGMVDLASGSELGDLLVSSFQTMIGIVNVERAQQGEKPMLLFLEQHGGIEYSAARLLPPGEGDGVDIAYNLVPACAMVGDTFLVGTHLALVREVAEQLRDGDTTEAAADRDSLELEGAGLRRVLRANYDALVMNAVLDEGKSLDEARSGVDALLSIVALFERAELSTRVVDGDQIDLELRLDLAEPSQ